MATWSQLGIHAKPIGVLNVAGFFDPLLALLEHAGREGFVSPGNLRRIVAADTPRGLLEAIRAHQPPEAPAWITAAES